MNKSHPLTEQNKFRHIDKPNTLLNLYLLFMFIAFAPLRWTIEIVNIFADNTVTMTSGSHIALIQTEK